MFPTRLTAAALMATAGLATPAAAQVLDAVYRGTLVCGDLPFASGRNREAIEVTISGGSVNFKHVVRLSNSAVEDNAEQGSGTLDGQKLELQGAWKGSVHGYQSRYGGTFVRRSAELKGTQTWTAGGKTFSRDCSGSIKRDFKPLLPKKPAG